MRQYLDLLKDILDNGSKKGDRTGTGTLSVFGRLLRFNLSDGFPLVTTKQVDMDLVIKELLWFISGNTNIRPLVLAGVNIWNRDAFRRYLEQLALDKTLEKYSYAWKLALKHYAQEIKDNEKFAETYGNLGPVYGAGWRNFEGVDQLAWVIDEIKSNPDSRRLLVSAWQPHRIKEMALPPCHVMYQFYVFDGKLSCQVYIRSWDVFLGGPFNIASYALLTMMVAQVTGTTAHELVICAGDAHLYLDHLAQAEEQIFRKPYPLPTMLMEYTIDDIEEFKITDFELRNYVHHPPIKGEMST
ncbi:MAG: Thymidylate synthase [Candidatus Woesebacteria bacterium GW2011_GWB1_43_14]|uniref:Thymidylate synthase n=1 Tax=Candidatus Woesebacteria bacterium GW2011_GWB1_43_14 TaxID=1618578 RepID=A0A0G1DGB4_9BACT|nr:MAG: Thymidylate synthase [Candidatus Woesebacteria bacterium GW2011_GWA1_39_11b]KKS77747.1 MAG: Thymidylate synthase [Candidatus Woesebacteria bacterium GW2011_GWC1_42_9]KKS96945.1 MAG: Thymidylate synthase [Candidatus Woesebacteria bacterium GW2011_GWB1_43_14]